MDRQLGLNDRINATITEFNFECGGSLSLGEVLAALDDAKSDAPMILGVSKDDEGASVECSYCGQRTKL